MHNVDKRRFDTRSWILPSCRQAGMLDSVGAVSTSRCQPTPANCQLNQVPKQIIILIQLRVIDMKPLQVLKQNLVIFS